jgi:uncharacterized protein YcgI (DUF1989 family)
MEISGTTKVRGRKTVRVTGVEGQSVDFIKAFAADAVGERLGAARTVQDTAIRFPSQGVAVVTLYTD